MKKTWIGAGWKMNMTLSEATVYAEVLKKFCDSEQPATEVFIVPPFTVLRDVCNFFDGNSVHVGAKNTHWDAQGSWTGEISPIMVKDCGATLIELGRSERRRHFGETDITVNKKVLSALKHGLRPLICVGERIDEKNRAVAREYVVRQVKMALAGVVLKEIADVIVAYEPVWAIGEAGTPAEPQYVNEIHGDIRRSIEELYGKNAAAEMVILYGGSVNQDNALAFLSETEVDGLFIGRSAWNADEFIQIIKRVTVNS